MRSASDPIRAAWLGTIVIGAAGLALCAVAAVWASRSINTETIDPDWTPPAKAPTQTESLGQQRRSQLAAFDRHLWTPPPPEDVDRVAEVSSPAPPPPPRLQLIGIVTPESSTSGTYLAILYDPDTDTTHILGSGESIGGLSIGDVNASGARLVTPHGETQLKLDTGQIRESRG